MTRKVVISIVAVFPLFVFVSCNQGLKPTEVEQKVLELEFPIKPGGGNPVGNWVPSAVDPLEVTIINPEKIPSAVDSLVFESQLTGSFIINRNRAYDIDAQLAITAHVYISGFPIPPIGPIADTLKGKGLYELIPDQVLIFDFGETTFDLDTLGFTAQNDVLSLITKPLTFTSLPFPGISDIKFFFVFNLVRASTESPLIDYQEQAWHRKKEEFK